MTGCARLRSVCTLILLPFLTLMVSVATLVSALVFRWPPARVQVFPRYLGRLLCRLAGVRVEIAMETPLAADRPVILAANHSSQFDIFVLQGYLDHDFRWMAKKELFRIPVFGPAMRRAGYIAVDRDHGRGGLRSLDEAARRIRGGASVLIFPEGTRSTDGRLQAFKAGGMVLALKAGVPVVPVAVSGTHQVLPKGRYLPRPGLVQIRVGAPLDISGYGMKEKKELAADLRRKIQDLLPPGS